MASKSKASDAAKIPVLKGKEAEEKVLEYMKRMNRPFGAVDVSANLKGVVPKAAAQKILVALAERGDLVQKTCGKTTFFVANQANLEDMPAEKLNALEVEFKAVDSENRSLVTECRTLGAEVARLKSAPTDSQLVVEIGRTVAAVDKIRAHLEPLRSGAPLMSEEETAELEGEWTKWRKEWVRRRRIFKTFWSMATDVLPPQQAKELDEQLGIESDTAEHETVERGALCTSAGSVLGKRRRC